MPKPGRLGNRCRPVRRAIGAAPNAASNDLLKEAAKHKLTPEEIFEQRVSWVYGQMRGDMTKDQVRAQILRMDGHP